MTIKRISGVNTTRNKSSLRRRRLLIRRVKKKMDAFVVKEMLGKNWMLFFFIRMRHIKRGEWKTTTSALIDDTHAHTLYIYIYMTSKLV